MTAVAVGTPHVRRVLGTVDQGRPGPTLVVLAGIHGNEPAGVIAVQRVLGQLQECELLLDGTFAAFAGNVRALQRGVRFVARDLNRRWLPQQLDALLARDAAGDGDEDREQRELVEQFDAVVAAARGPVVFVDLHSSSADGPPFVCLADTIDNRRVAMATGVPLILGIEETIDGASLEWWSRRGIVNFAVEGGRHGHPDTVRNHEAVLWILLERLGLLRPGKVDVAPFRRHIAATTAGVPKVVEIVRRHAIAPGDRFVMRPGFVNFQRVHKGEPLADDRSGVVRAPFAGRVMLPLYQAQGDDGFFLAREVAPFWLAVAAALRRLRVDAVLPWLPGVRRDPDDPATLLVDRRVARWFATEVFHLLGYRRQRPRDDRTLAFTRRVSLPANRSLP